MNHCAMLYGLFFVLLCLCAFVLSCECAAFMIYGAVLYMLLKWCLILCLLKRECVICLLFIL